MDGSRKFEWKYFQQRYRHLELGSSAMGAVYVRTTAGIEVHPENMTLILISDSRLPQPYNCPDEIFAIMSSCWIYEAIKRPTTAELSRAMSDFSSQLKKYI